MSDIAINAENLSKRYRIGLKEELPDTLMGAMTSWLTAPLTNFRDLRRLSHFSDNGHDDPDILYALKDVSFEIKQGEVVGIVGRNGAGKSTLLKILSRIVEPTSGRAVINGRVASLLEVGTGFHPDLTGRENVYLNGTVLGMTKREIDRKFDEIVDFSGVEKFIDTPVKRYSSGMQVRLAFAVAAHLEPEILLVDEVLAVGDAEFQKKCLGKMGEVAEGGRTVLFVSHNMAAMQNLCNSAYLFSQGEIVAYGNIEDVIKQYLQETYSFKLSLLDNNIARQGSGKLQFVDFYILDVGKRAEAVRCGSPVSFVIAYKATSKPENIRISIGLHTLFGERIAYLGNDVVGQQFENLPLVGKLKCSLEKLSLLPGIYIVNLHCELNGVVSDWVKNAAQIHVIEGDYFGTGKLPNSGYGSMAVPHLWSILSDTILDGD